MASDWQNASLIRDVDNSSLITPLDALLIINNLNGNGSRELMPRVQHTGVMSYDVNADNYLTPLDVLVVINAINSLGNSQATVVGGLAPASDPNNNGVVLTDHVTIRGQTLANSFVSVSLDRSDSRTVVLNCSEVPCTSETVEDNRSTLADEQGRFTFDLPVAEGLQRVRLSHLPRRPLEPYLPSRYFSMNRTVA
jgi:hypothetical protein